MTFNILARKSTEQERELRKRERWLRSSRRKEILVKFIDHIFINIKKFFTKLGNTIKILFQKRTDEEKEIMKRKKWLKASLRREKRKAKIKEFKENLSNKLSKFKKNKKNELMVVEPEYQFKSFEEQVKEAKENKRLKELEEKNQEKMEIVEVELPKKSFNPLKKPNFILIKDEKKEKTWEDKEFEKIKRSVNFQIKVNKFKETINNGKIFKLKQIEKNKKPLRIEAKLTMDDINNEYIRYVRNLKHFKMVTGLYMTVGSTIVLSLKEFPINVCDMAVIAVYLNVGLFNYIDGMFLEPPEFPKVKKFKL